MVTAKVAGPVTGQFMHPVIDNETKNSDPWQRDYFQPPPLERLVPRSYPLVDIRPLMSASGYSPTELLKSHGFGVVKHESPFLEQMKLQSLDKQALTDIYHPEVKKLVCDVTGAKSVFISASVLRIGKRAPETFRFPVTVKPVASAERQRQGSDSNGQPAPHELAGQSNMGLAAPVRLPHLDYTPLGARQTIRCQQQDILDAATEFGIIPCEDAICQSQGVYALTRDADAILAENYNNKGHEGPRYAAYSIWRPLRKVERDPLTLAPRRQERPKADGEMVYWPYLNRVPGPKELHGDFVKEYAMLGVQAEGSPVQADGRTHSNENDLKWYYVSSQEPDEVLFIKLFDSAALGPNAEHATSPWHGSPEIGDAQGTEPRESVDIRVLAFF